MDASTNWLLLAFVLLVIALALLVSRSRGAARREMEKVASVLVMGAPASNWSAGSRGRAGPIGLIEPLVDFDPTSNFDSVAFDADSADLVDRAYMTAGPRQLARQSGPYRPYSCGRAAFDAEITSLLRALKAADEYLRPDWPAALLPESESASDLSASDLPAADKSAPGAPTPGEVRRAAEVRRRVMHRLRVLPALHAALGDYHAALGCVALTGANGAAQPSVAPDEAARRRARVAVLNAQTWALEDYRDYVRRGASYLEYEGRESDARRLRCVLRAIDSVM
jgi:hypothetical protein